MSGSSRQPHSQVSFAAPGNVRVNDQNMDGDDSESEAGDQSVTVSQDAFQKEVNKKILGDLLSRMSRCHNLPELLRTIPAPAQEKTKIVLEKVTEAFTRIGVCEITLNTWQDALNKGEYKDITELNSLKAPSVQLSKLAKEADEPALNALNFDLTITNAKRAALVQMIAIKNKEIENLGSFCNEEEICEKIDDIWKEVHQKSGVTPEHLTILSDHGCVERLVQMAISIGHNSLARSANNKKKKQEKKTEAEVDKTDIPTNAKSFAALFHEMRKRERQSEKDKRINAKKGSGRAGPPKTLKNPKTGTAKVQKPKQKKVPTRKGKKAGTSTKRRQGRR